MKIKLLSNKQEIQILDLIAQNYECDDMGASRMIFFIDTQELIDIGLELNSNYLYVVKVAIGIAGINQTRIESSAFEFFGDKDSPLAPIPYIGHYVEVMERVEPLSSSLRSYTRLNREDFISVLEEEEDYDKDFCSKLYDVIQELHNINGYTSDNGQIGISCNDEHIVAYDYGYQEDSCDELCSDLGDFLDFYDTNELIKYIEALIDIIDKEESAIIELEKKIMHEFD